MTATLFPRPPPAALRHTRSARAMSPRPAGGVRARARLLVVVEGVNDIEFLTRISARLHAEDPSLPDLSALEQHGALIFVPFGGGGVQLWTDRLSGLGLPEFHLYDRETPPETERRMSAARLVNGRPGGTAVVTSKRSLENYLHPAVLLAAGGPALKFGDDDSVPELVAAALFARHGHAIAWHDLPRRARGRSLFRAKRWLNTAVASRMTAELLAERDPQGELRSWLRRIAALAAPNR